MSSERYELTQDELEALLERVESTMELMTDKKKRVNSEEHRYWMTRTRSELNDARGFIQEMEKEARAAPAQYRYLLGELETITTCKLSFESYIFTNLFCSFHLFSAI